MKNTIRQYVKHVLLEFVTTLSDSADNDWPGADIKNSMASFKRSRKVVLFSPERNYEETSDLTHGLESHAIKHLAEFNHQLVNDELLKFKEWLVKNGKESYDYIQKGKKGKPGVRGKIASIDIDVGTLLNSIDLVNDLLEIGIPIADLTEEERVLWRYSNVLVAEYSDIMNETRRDIQDVSDAYFSSEEELYNYLSDAWSGKESPNILFSTIYKDRAGFMVYDVVDGAIIAGKDRDLAHPSTLYARFKYTKPKSLNDALNAIGIQTSITIAPGYSIFGNLIKKIAGVS